MLIHCSVCTQIYDVVRRFVEITERRKCVETGRVQAVALFHGNFGKIVKVPSGYGGPERLESGGNDGVCAMAQQRGSGGAALHPFRGRRGFLLIGNDDDAGAQLRPVRMREYLAGFFCLRRTF